MLGSERMCEGVEELVAESRVWQQQGERSPAHWMARRTGEPVGHAVAAPWLRAARPASRT